MPALLPFDTCCGLQIGSGFQHGRQSGIDFLIQPLIPHHALQRKGQNTVICLNETQRVSYKDALEKGGWVLIYEFLNHNYGNVLGLYFRDIDPEMSPGNPKFNKDVYEIYKSPASLKVKYVRKINSNWEPL